jgi:WD40 repeat protein
MAAISWKGQESVRLVIPPTSSSKCAVQLQKELFRPESWIVGIAFLRSLKGRTRTDRFSISNVCSSGILASPITKSTAAYGADLPAQSTGASLSSLSPRSAPPPGRVTRRRVAASPPTRAMEPLPGHELPPGELPAGEIDSPPGGIDLPPGAFQLPPGAIKLEGHDHRFTLVIVLPDGDRLVTSFDKNVRVHCARTGECLRVLSGHGAAVKRLAALGGDIVASCDWGSDLCLWDISSAGAPLLLGRN